MLFRVARNVSRQFRQPELATRSGRSTAAAVVPVPEAAVDEDGKPTAGKDDVGTTRETTPVKAESEPHPMKGGTDGELRGGVSVTDEAHDSAALGAWVDVGHALSPIRQCADSDQGV